MSNILQILQITTQSPASWIQKIRPSNSEKVTQLRLSIERHLNTKLNDLQCFVANHHWEFIEKRTNPSTPLSVDVARKYGIHEVCDRFKVLSDKVNPNKNSVKQLYIKAPIASKEEVRRLCTVSTRKSLVIGKRKRIEDIEEQRRKDVEEKRLCVELDLEKKNVVVQNNECTLIHLDITKWVDMMIARWNVFEKCESMFLSDAEVMIGISVLQNVIKDKSVPNCD